MSHPPVAAAPTSTINDAACLMLKYKVHRIPVVDAGKRCIGMVTRTDVFTALAVESGRESERMNMDL
jgi:CBS domain-containing protein